MNTRHFSRRSFLKTVAGATAAAPFFSHRLLSQPASGVLRHASFGASGMAWSDLSEIAKCKNVELVAVADVDLNRTAEFRKKFPHARVYQDWRELLEVEGKRIDSVNVSTPDHMHAPIAMSAMELGKHVYVEKPMAHDIFEVRRLTEFARKKRLVSQMGIQINSSPHYRTASALARSGAIGKIKEVHSWCPKGWGDMEPLPSRQDTPPEGFNWDLWLGTAAERPFIGNGYYHPANWRKRLDFGTGTFGDMGCHIFDPVFTSLQLTAPLAVRSEGPAPNAWNWALNSKIEYVFPATPYTTGESVKVTWYDGNQRPPAEVVKLLEGDKLPDIGSILVGTAGTMVIPHVSRPLLYPDKVFQSMPYPEVPGSDHWERFVDACLTGARTTAGFDYSGPLTEAVLMGCIASRFPQTTLRWDAKAMQFDLADANVFLRRRYREGWGVRGLKA